MVTKSLLIMLSSYKDPIRYFNLTQYFEVHKNIGTYKDIINYCLTNNLDINFTGFISTIDTSHYIVTYDENNYRLIIINKSESEDNIIDYRSHNSFNVIQLDITFKGINIKISKPYENTDIIELYLGETLIKKMVEEINSIDNVAKYFYYANRAKFSHTNGYWYQFDKHYWIIVKDKQRFDNFNRIIDNYLRKFGYSYKWFNKENENYIFFNLKASFMNKIMLLLTDPSFCEKLNLNSNLICFTNGVFDLEKIEFRNGLPEDYISNVIDHDYDLVLDRIIRRISEKK